MKNTTVKKTFNFGKIKYTNKSKRVNEVIVKVELRSCGGEDIFTIDPKTKERVYTGEKTPEYKELAICGYVYNARHTDCVMCGQCLDSINRYKKQLNDPKTFGILFDLWQKYHLNGMHAGTPEQEAAIDEWKAQGNKYDYTAACEMLKERGLYEVNYTGLSVGRKYENEPYKYGHGWLVQELPVDVLHTLENLLNA